MYGYEADNRWSRMRFPLVTALLIAANVLVFLLETMAGGSTKTAVAIAYGAEYTPFVMDGQWWRLFTSMFVHFGSDHLFSNMISLIYMGYLLENQYGRIRFLIIYLVSGLVGNAASMVMDLVTKHYVLSAGASGAVFGLVGAYAGAALIDKRKTDRRSSPILMIGLAVYMFVRNMGVGVDIWAHLGGMIGGFILGILLRDNDHNGTPDFLQQDI